MLFYVNNENILLPDHKFVFMNILMTYSSDYLAMKRDYN